MKHTLLEFFKTLKKWKARFWSFLKLWKNEKHVFGAVFNFEKMKNTFLKVFLTLTKMKSTFLELLKLWKKWKHVIGAVFNFEKMKSTFLELLKLWKMKSTFLELSHTFQFFQKFEISFFFKNSEISMILSSDIASSMYAMNLVDGALETLDPEEN